MYVTSSRYKYSFLQKAKPNLHKKSRNQQNQNTKQYQFAKENPVIYSLRPEATLSFRQRALRAPFPGGKQHGGASGRRLIGALLKTDTCGGLRALLCFVWCGAVSFSVMKNRSTEIVFVRRLEIKHKSQRFFN